ncbi:hypothetical protein QM480_19105 [Flectobacillus sp. DC10W]|uniref:Transporter n=1 Tax=Flectobacillus longus TaxID=2984207 RepID=A0ABT6YTN7_9BACT|nr:hypothetical protein [Flectobacillus longus]MDI9866458.1 hypothetical protein [Flectobacillus longus]
MRFKIFLLIFCCTFFYESRACDICGCSNGNAFFGILPQSHRGFLGLRYRYSNFDSHLNSQLLKTKESFHTTELWGRFYPLKKVQILAFVPYNFNAQTQILPNITNTIQGLGDITILGHYNVLNTFWDSTAHQVNHNLMLGLGVKAPTGKFKYDQNSVEEVANPNFQLGTGSTDFLVNAIYTVRYDQWGLNTDITYKINTENSNQYRYGNKLTTALTAFYAKGFGQGNTLMPNAGVYWEYAQNDHDKGIINKDTGGYWASANIGCEAFFKKFSFGVTHQMPFAQELSRGELKANARTTAHITFMF